MKTVVRCFVAVISCWLVLVSNAMAYTLSGTVYGASNPMVGATVTLSDANTAAQVGQVASDTSGRYSFTVTAGTFNLVVTPTDMTRFKESRINTIVVGISDVTQDVVMLSNLPYTVSGGVTWIGSGNQIAPSVFFGQGMGSQHDANSCNQMWVSGGTSIQAARQLVGTDGRFSFATDAATNRCLGMNVYWYLTASGPTGTMPPMGTVTLGMGSFNASGGAFDVTASMEKSIAVPSLVKISGKTTDANGVAVKGVAVSANGLMAASDWNYTATVSVTSDDQGNYTVYLPAMNYTFTITPPSGHSGKVRSFNVNVTGDISQSLDLAFSALPYTVSGGVTWIGSGNQIAPSVFFGQGVGSQQGAYSCNAMWVSGGTSIQAARQLVGADGRFSFATDAATNRCLGMNVYWYLTASGPTGTMPPLGTATLGMGSFNASGGTFDVIASMEKSISVPSLVKISGKTTDANGVAVKGVAVSANGLMAASDWNYTATVSATSDDQGNYTLYLPAMDYTFTITPPFGSGFTPTQVKLSVVGDLGQSIILPFKDTVPPNIVSGPTFRSLTSSSVVVEWQTDEPSRGWAKAGAITSLADDLATTHSVQITGLNPSTAYTAEISVTDATGNGPTVKNANFTTAAIEDVIPPIILEGPTVTASTANGMVVEWTTSEPAKGSLSYGVGGVLGSSVPETILSVTHRIELTGLVADTSYSVRVSATDAAGNGPTLSRTRTGRTLPAPDVTPPVIVNGPLVSDITDSAATIAWKTDEPSTGGVSWNDGVAYGVLTDEKLDTVHSARITGLVASKIYHLTVSSKDALGNGPTLSKTVDFTTQAVADTTAPVILSGPAVISITNQSAVIQWDTDEPADSQAVYGTNPANLDKSESRAALTKKHSLPLVGLSPSAAYTVQVRSKDAAGNASVYSQPISFTTTANPDTSLPVFDAPPQVGYTSTDRAVIKWKTNKLTDAQLQVAQNGQQMQLKNVGTQSDAHEVALTGLQPSQSYSVTVTSTDLAGNTTSQSLGDFATPPAPDTAAPVITQAPSVQSVGATTATVTWGTDKLADSRASYGLAGGALNQVTGDISYGLAHTVVLTKLQPSTAYQVQVGSADPSGNGPTLSARVSFSTLSATGTGSSTTAATTSTTGATTSTTVTPTTSTTTGSTTTTTAIGSTTTTLIPGTTTTILSTSTTTASTTTTTLASQSRIDFIAGWNLVGNGNEAVLDVTAAFGDTTKVTTVWKWVAAKNSWAFYAPSLTAQVLIDYTVSKGYDILTSINAGEGFWVNAKTPFSANLPAGARIASSSFKAGGAHALSSGWSLIATGDSPTPATFNSSLSLTPPSAGTTPINLTTLWAWNPTQSNWYFWAPSLVNSGQLSSYLASKGYLDFTTLTTTPPGSLSPATGFWVNLP